MSRVIRIRRNSKHAEIAVPRGGAEPNDEIKLQLIAWLVSDLGRRLGVEEIEFAYEPEDRTDEKI
jgi:hypothetical protein